MSSGYSTMEVGKDLKCVLVDVQFSFSKNDGNKRKILDMLLKLEDAVNNANGIYSDRWEDVNDERKVKINLELPDRAHVDEICGYFNDIKALLPEISGSDTEEGNETRMMPEQCTSTQLQQKDSPQEGQSNNTTKEEKGRTKHSCPFADCKSSVVHLPRHMRRCHGWSPRKARSVLNSFNIRKAKSTATHTGKTKRTYKSVICPVDGCNSIVKRLHNHLTDVHKMKTGSKFYKKCLAHAVRHEVEVLDTGESSESSDFSNTSVSSSEYKLPTKKTTHVKRVANVYDTIYGGTEDDNEMSDIPLQSDVPSESEKCNDEDNDAASAQILDAKLQSLFNKFEHWLRCADGGEKDHRSATQCRQQVKLIVEYINSSNPCLTNILHKTTIREKWLEKFEKERQPGTVKSYLGSLKLFYDFLKCEDTDVNVSSEQLTSLSAQATLWIKSFRKKSIDRFWEKRMEDMRSIRTPEQVREFDTSEVSRAAVRLLGEYQDQEREPPIQAEYTSVRDYLLTVLCINNGSRSGTLANMTLRQFEEATKEDECFVVRVKDHKTFTTHGPVNVVFTASLYKYTQIFIKNFRNCLGDVSIDGDSPVFLSVNQRKMMSSQVGVQIGSCWGKVFGKDTSLGGATAFRKAAVSAVH